MMQRLIFTLITIIALVPRSFSASIPNYKEWLELPSASLLDMGKRYLNSENTLPDSAFLCYTIVANRNISSPNDKQTAIDASRALNNLGYIYCYFYYDYEKAYVSLHKALELANKYGNNKILPYIYVNLGNLKFTDQRLLESNAFISNIQFYIKGFDIAVKNRDWDIMLVNY